MTALDIEVTATDRHAQTVKDSFTINITPNSDPVTDNTYAIPDYVVANGTGLRPGQLFDISFDSRLFTDANNDPLTLSACQVIDAATCAPLPYIWGTQNLEFIPADFRFTGIPQDVTDSGTITIRVSATDGFSDTVPATDEFNIEVNTVPTVKTANIPVNQNARQGISFSYTPTQPFFEDADGHTINI